VLGDPHQDKGQGRKKRRKPPYNKQVRRLRIIKYLQLEDEPRSENELRERGLEGISYREVHKDVMELCRYGVCERIRISKGRRRNRETFVIKLTEKRGKTFSLMASDPSIKSLLEEGLGLPTTYNFRGHGQINDCDTI
jgi:hypothetical protein